MQRYGHRWHDIKLTFAALSGRTPSDLKEKYRRLVKKQFSKPKVHDETSARRRVTGKGSAGAHKQNSTRKRKRKAFTKAEERELLRLVKIHGNKWARIHDLGDFHPCRKPEHLKDKHRNLLGARKHT